jgi:REP element-mobilizing transposase RayT
MVMPCDPFKHRRRSIRLPGYDYSASGGYFVTICTHRSAHLFGEIIGGGMRLNDWGNIADDELMKTPAIRREIELDEFQIMPNHMHGILIIVEKANGAAVAQRRCAPTMTSLRPHVDPGSIGASSAHTNPRSHVESIKSITPRARKFGNAIIMNT